MCSSHRPTEGADSAPVHWRVYGDGREFGIDFPTVETARATRLRYARNFPHVRYTIRRHDGPALALASVAP